MFYVSAEATSARMLSFGLDTGSQSFLPPRVYWTVDDKRCLKSAQKSLRCVKLLLLLRKPRSWF